MARNSAPDRQAEYSSNQRRSRPRHLRRIAGASLIVGWFPVAISEILYDTMDDFRLLGQIAANTGRMTAGALIQLFGAFVLVLAVLAMVHLAHARAPVLTALGGTLSLAGAVGLGAFSQLHLLVAELADPSLDREAMSAFVQRFEDFGAWSVPTLFVLLGMTIGLPLLVVAVRRTRLISLLPVAFVVAHVPVHFASPAQWAETLAHLLLAGGLALVGLRVLQLSDSRWASPPSIPHSSASPAEQTT